MIVAEGLTKEYRLSALQVSHDTLRDQVAHAVKRMWRGSASGAESDNRFLALNDVSFTVREGEVVGLIGRNGAGKSTLLKVLSRITFPTSGSASIHGRVASLLEVGTGFQPELSGRENVYLSGAILGMRKAEIARRFDEIVDFAGVARFIDTPVKRYSSGMYVRLAFAVAAHLEPEVMFIDEVLAVGDVGFQKKCLAKMDDVARGGRTILFVSHNLAAVRSLCPRSIFLRGGGVVADGPSDQVIARYVSEYDDNGPRGACERISGDAMFVEGSDEFFLYPADRSTAVQVLCGEPIVLQFEIESPKPLVELSAGALIMSSSGERIAGMSSKVQRIRAVGRPSQRWLVRCDMGRLPLNAGTYAVDVYIGNGVMDVTRFPSAFELTVTEHDVFGWGNSLPPQTAWGPLYWAPTWHIAASGSSREMEEAVQR